MDPELIDNIRKRSKDLTELIRRIDLKMKGFPEGAIRVKHDRKSTYFCHQKGNKEHYLDGEKDLELIRSLTQKSYLQKVRKQAEKELSALQKTESGYPDIRAEDVYGNESEDKRDLIRPIVLTDEQYKAKWLAKPYEKKKTEGTPCFTTQSGEVVKSKSEKIIADALLNRDVPYKYECPLRLGDRTVYPDFTILRMSDRQEIYYEHLGRMDDPAYVERNIKKINDYALNGYCPGVRLFTTMETGNEPLNTEVLEVMIETLFR